MFLILKSFLKGGISGGPLAHIPRVSCGDHRKDCWGIRLSSFHPAHSHSREGSSGHWALGKCVLSEWVDKLMVDHI